MNPVDVAVIAVALTAHLTASVYAYLDAPDHGMDARRWGLRSVAVPMFGFFAYLFEKEEKKRETTDDDREDMFSDGIFEVHESRADDTSLADSDEYDYDPEDV
ncbi:hypothetical protein EGH25_10035 [Haladaptatus sp. F3-133]|jgi:hypothetical protein|uniref:Uncharacterized protein n=1 Tax=Halorutilus salinus TaxID=2487751 RepID=A0A9Q4C5U3_9EURY|nr:hypothetical protein [Halorutilus salinus]MCX2819685.1 hypothetical protein [Halorutilus salinus]